MKAEYLAFTALFFIIAAINVTIMLDIESLYSIYQAHPDVFTDSRKVKKNGLFFALKGDSFDGNQFAQKALEEGAAYAIVDDPKLAQNDSRMLLVQDSLLTLQDLARFHRQQFAIPFVGITGSNGKTTTKELISRVLSKKYDTYFTQGNYNNHIGVPLTILSIPGAAEMAVIEMGANHVKEIAFLCSISQPTHGLITNIGKAHLEGFGGLEGVKKGKSELYDSLAENNGIAFVNKSERFLESLSTKVKQQVTYQKASNESFFNKNDYGVQLLSSAPFVNVVFTDKNQKKWTAHSQLAGEYNFNNISTAIAIGLFFEVESSLIIEAIEEYLPQNNRSQILKLGTNTIILDAYNANPSSMKEALNNLERMGSERKIAILGDMLELGEYSTEEHTAIFELAKTKNLNQIILVGQEFAKINADNEFIFQNVDELKNGWDLEKIEDTLILIKGSRGIKLEKVLLDD